MESGLPRFKPFTSRLLDYSREVVSASWSGLTAAPSCPGLRRRSSVRESQCCSAPRESRTIWVSQELRVPRQGAAGARRTPEADLSQRRKCSRGPGDQGYSKSRQEPREPGASQETDWSQHQN
ncbi:hypothetical protein NDU88_003647 [Pleurodeles waltl]|uniref:Uncharacterized protein n=1 Tax=Pleurodeles waltl TaxID=8319 RepID=A0AAV7T6T4_PLEWA|nr:hypothetical protein NDU88_003647 [Pleurodeles waltl]